MVAEQVQRLVGAEEAAAPRKLPVVPVLVARVGLMMGDFAAVQVLLF